MAEFTTRCGVVVQIDEADRERFNKHSWRIDKHGYAYRKSSDGARKGTCLFMHREVFGALPGQMIDHKDGDRKNNQRENLRLASHSLNQANQRKRAGCSSKHKGVQFVKKTGRWHAAIRANHKHFNLGDHDTEDEAGHAYNKAAIKHFGEFACLNPIGEDYEHAARNQTNTKD